MYYDKKLRYLDYLENGERIRNVGFVKIEVMDQLCNIQVQVTGLHASDNSSREVRLLGVQSHGAQFPEEQSEEEGPQKGLLQEGILGTIAFQAGRGSLLRKRISAANLCDGIGYEELTAIRINLGKSRELVCRWKEDGQQPELQPELRSELQPKLQPELQPELQSELQPDSEKQEAAGSQPVSSLESTVNAWREQIQKGKNLPEPVRPEPMQTQWEPKQEQKQEQMQQMNLQEVPEREIPEQEIFEQEQLQEEMMSETWEEQLQSQSCEEASDRGELSDEQEPEEQKWSIPDPSQRNEPVMPLSLSEDKWKQLSAIYPHIAPFHDERDYLSIGPGDFVILPRKYYRLVTNSFLLHGFYNYGHMVLARTVKKGEEQFYLGVPGNFYERERQVAIMFGFESFECKTEPVQMGDYGYFMIRVEL